MDIRDSLRDRSEFSLHELLEASARSALELQRDDGSLPPARNGIYDEPETPVRTTSNWLTTFSKVYSISGDVEFADAANAAADYLLNNNMRSNGYTYYSRNTENKDKCNGLMGQSAPIRGLILAGITFDRPELINEAEEVFHLHPFDSDIGLWKKREVDGSVLSFDRTLNHQLSFAAASSIFPKNKERISRKVNIFIDKLDLNMGVHSDGIINHYVRPPVNALARSTPDRDTHVVMLFNEAMYRLRSKLGKMKQKEIEYHPLNLYILGQLKSEFPNKNLWDKQIINKLLEPTRSNLQQNEPSTEMGSMLPGIQLAYAILTLDSNREDVAHNFLQYDITNHFDFDRCLFSKNSVDPELKSSLIVYLTEFSDLRISV